jgi:hypothetical protein
MQAPDAALDTLRLRLRIPESSDAEPLMEIHQDPEVIKSILLTAPPGGITVAWRNIAMMVGHWHLRGYGQWTVIEKTSGEVEDEPDARSRTTRRKQQSAAARSSRQVPTGLSTPIPRDGRRHSGT